MAPLAGRRALRGRALRGLAEGRRGLCGAQPVTEARGRKKKNFGQAAQSLRRQRQQQQQQGRGWEAQLPDKILKNPAWIRALRQLKGGHASRPPAWTDLTRRTRRQPGPLDSLNAKALADSRNDSPTKPAQGTKPPAPKPPPAETTDIARPGTHTYAQEGAPPPQAAEQGGG